MSSRSRKPKLLSVIFKKFRIYINKNKFAFNKDLYENYIVRSLKGFFDVKEVKLDKEYANFLWNNRFVLTDFEGNTFNKVIRCRLYYGDTFILQNLSEFIDEIIVITIRNKEYTFCHGIIKVKKI